MAELPGRRLASDEERVGVAVGSGDYQRQRLEQEEHGGEGRVDVAAVLWPEMPSSHPRHRGRLFATEA